MPIPHSTGELRRSYARWRASQIGHITDRLEQELLLELLGPVSGQTLLDVGCGDGILAGEIARRGSVVTGLDADALMIAAAGRQAEASQFQLHFLVGRAENLPFPDATFNRVLAVTTLCFVQDAEQAIGEMARVLKPGGSLVIGELGRGAFGPLTDEFELGSVIRLGGWQDSARRLDFAALCPPPVWT